MSIEVKNLKFSYGKNEVLSNISFSAQKGDFIAVLGPNGAGKSTLFRCILGFIEDYSGEVLIDFENTLKMNSKTLASKIAYVPQYSTPAFNYTVLDCVLMGMTNSLSSFSSPKTEHINKAMGILKSLGIEHLKNRGCSKISGGERQLTLLARALAQDAKILILDEPSANLDYGNRHKIMSKISRLAQNGYTIIMSTHEPNQAFLYANKALALKSGKILSFGSPKEVLSEKTLSDLYGMEVKKADVDCDGKKLTLCIPKGEKRPMMYLWKPDMINYMKSASQYGDYNKLLAKHISKYLKKDDKICDSGCGLGYLSLELAKYVQHVTSIDINENALSVLKENSSNIFNISAINADLWSFERKEKFDAMIFNYFGRTDEIIKLSKQHCNGKIIIVKRNSHKSGFSLDDNVLNRRAEFKTEKFLSDNNISYIEEELALEFGQPLKSEEDAVNFFCTYKSADAPKITYDDIKSKLINTDNKDYPLYYPYKKEIKIIVIETKDIEEDLYAKLI